MEYERGYRLAPVDVVREYESALGLEAGSLVALRTQAQSARAAIGRDGSLPVQQAVPPTAATASTGAAARPPVPTSNEPRRARPLARSRSALIALAIVVLAAVGLAVGFGGLVGGGKPARQTAAIELPPGGVGPSPAGCFRELPT